MTKANVFFRLVYAPETSTVDLPFGEKVPMRRATLVYRAAVPAFRSDVPNAVAIVELEEGFFLTKNIVDCPVDKIEIGMLVEIEYADVTDDVTLP